MSERKRIRIKDIADELGVSTATVSNVLHGKTKKISKETVCRVQQLLEEKQYIPNMAAVLLAQNSSQIICLVVAEHEKYGNQLLQDPFVSALINELALEIEAKGYFMMIKRTKEIREVIRYASMWNMAGLVLQGFCKQDYDNLRRNIRIPFVVMDGFYEPQSKWANIAIDNMDGGFQVGNFLIDKGHEKVLFVADNNEDIDLERRMGLIKAYQERGYKLDEHVFFMQISPNHKVRYQEYAELLKSIKQVTAIFCASDAYAIEIMNYLQDMHISVPEQISIVGFDDLPAATLVRPKLTTVRQDIRKRAIEALNFLDGNEDSRNIIMPVSVVERESVKQIVK